MGISLFPLGLGMLVTSQPVSADVTATSTSSSAVRTDAISESSSSAAKAETTSASSSSAVKAETTSASSSSAAKAETAAITTAGVANADSQTSAEVTADSTSTSQVVTNNSNNQNNTAQPAGQEAAPVSEDTSSDDSERTTPTVANNDKPAIDSVDTSQPATAAPKADTDVSTLQVDATTKTDSDIKEDTPTDKTTDTKTVQLTTVEGTSKQVVTTPKEESSTDKSSSVVSKQTDKTSLPTVATATATTVSKIPSVTGDYQFDEKTKTYTFTGKDGHPVTGLVYANNILQYFDETGHQVKGQYVTIAGHVYYFDPASGAAQTGVNQIDGKMVGFKSDGSQITSGFSNDNAGNSYYFDESGTMVTGRQTIAGKTYYFDKDGHLRKGYSTIIDNQLYYFDLKTGESVSTTTSNFKSGLTSQTDDTTPHNSAVNMSKDSFTTVDGFLTAESWYVPKDIQTSATDWRASTPEDFRPIMMTWWPTKQIQAAYLNHMVSEGLLSSDKKFSATDDQTLLNQAAHAVQLQIELKIQQTKSVEWLRTTMHNFIKSQPGYNVTSETPSNDHLQGGALSYINSVLTPDANSNFRLMNRNPTQQDGTRHYNTDTSEGGYELLLANDVDNSNPVVQAEQLNWLYFLTHFGEIVKNDPSANFDSVRVDAVDNVDADLLNITAAYFRDVYGVDKNDLTANQHLSILEDWGHNDPLYVKDHGSDQLTMDDYMHTQLIWSLTKNPDNRSAMRRFMEYYLVDRAKDNTSDQAIPNYSFVRAHDSEVQTVIGDIVAKLYPDVKNSLAPSMEQLAAAFKVYDADMNSVNKKYTQYNMPAAYAMLLTNKDTIPRVYYGDMYTDDGQYMATKSPYYDAISALLKARIKYVAGGQTMAVDKHDILTSVRFGDGIMNASDKGSTTARTQGIGVIVSNNDALALKGDTVTLHMGIAHANQAYRALLLTTTDGLMKYTSDNGAPIRYTDANGDLIFTSADIKGYQNVEVSGFLSVWVPVGASDTQDARATGSSAANKTGDTLHSNAALDSNVIYEGFSNFQEMPTTHDEFTNVKIAQNADLFKSWGVTSFQLAPQYRSSDDTSFLDSIIKNGYAFTDRYDLGFNTPTKYGDVDDLADAIRAMHSVGIQVMADFVPDQIYNLPGQEVVAVNRTNNFGTPNQDSDLQNQLYVTNSKGGGEYQAKYGGEFLDLLRLEHPDLFTTNQISTGVPIDGSTKIKEWSAKYFNGSDIQGKGADYVLKDGASQEYFKITSNANDESFLPKQFMNQDAMTGFTTDEKGTTYYSTSGYQAKQSFIQGDDGQYYYFDADGYMVTGSQTINGKQYYFLPNGVELREAFLQNASGNTVYYGKTGSAVKSKYVVDQSGVAYYFDVNGNMVADRMMILDGHTQYFFAGGSQAKDQFLIGSDGNLRYFDQGSGNMVTNRFAVNRNGDWFYFNGDGIALKGWQTIAGKTYFFDADGRQVKAAAEQAAAEQAAADKAAADKAAAEQAAAEQAAADKAAADKAAAEQAAADKAAAEQAAADKAAADKAAAEQAAADKAAADKAAAEQAAAEQAAADKAAAEQAAADKAAAEQAAAEQAAADKAAAKDKQTQAVAYAATKAKNNIDQATTADGINDAQATGITDIDNQHVPGTSVDNQKQAEKVTEDIKNDPDNKTLPEAIELPNTGVDKTESITITGVVMLILTTIFGLLFTSKKHKKD
ncbi:glycoside hydrolase family 70 protein [Latilactobacillus curvatus]|uniref:glycoside hydrolase family 70 protein n=1 Tax=Latilactobacillus curvatus TaxID=28038 RepID=UPI0021A4B8D4|nr:glycoside hydrolase family 70 protein [Latilactobacillus curvatus]